MTNKWFAKLETFFFPKKTNNLNLNKGGGHKTYYSPENLNSG